MDTLFDRACGLDIHKETIVACVRTVDPGRTKPRREARTFAAHLQGLTELREWLIEQEVRAIAMEGTGIYWRPVYAVLERGAPWTLVVGNAQHIKNVPGRKTDVKDAEWLADLVAHGLIHASFIPAPTIRELRDVTRMRVKLVTDRTRARNRVLKVLQLAGIKLDGVASDAFGKSGMAILERLAEGDATPQEMAALARGVLRKKIDALQLALESPLSATHRKMLGLALTRLQQLESELAAYDALIDELLAPCAEQMALLVTMPGVDRVAAATIVAELGPDMSVFPSANHAASWAGLSPGNHESAGRRGPGTTTKGNRYLKTMLCQASHSAVRVKKNGGYLREKFYRLKARRGHNKATMAVAHKLIIAAFHMLTKMVPYEDLGGDYLAARDKKRTVASLVGRLRALGVDVDVRAPQPT